MLRVFAGWLYFWGILALVVGVLLYVMHRPDVPDKDDLVEYTGFLLAVGLEKDFDGTDIVLRRPMLVGKKEFFGICSPFFKSFFRQSHQATGT